MSKAQENVITLKALSVTADPGEVGFWPDVTAGTRILWGRDRTFFGSAALYTGNIAAPYGTDPISANVASYLIKNSQVAVGSINGRIGFMGFSNLSDTDTTGSSIAVAGVARAKLALGATRSFYGDVTRESGAGAVFGLEVAGTNRGSDISGNSYSTLSSGVFGLHLTMQQGVGYTVGDANTPVTPGSAPGTFAINIAAGSGGSFQAWNGGIRFTAGSLTGCDGTTGTAQALQLAKGHEINWMAGTTIQGAKIRSDITASAGFDVSQIFEPGVVSFYGTTGKRMFRSQHAASGVNNVNIQNAASAFYPVLRAEGDDAIVGMFFCSKSTGRFSFYTGDTSHEEFRVGGTTALSVNYLHAYGSISTAAVASLEAKGTDANISVKVIPKGTGALEILLANCQQAVNDAAAEAAGVPVGGLYRNASAVQIRIV